jgi:F-type H+-transporting ATPase subunit epsilon
MKLEIVTPQGVLFENEVKSVNAPGVSGQFQVLNNHANILSGLEIGFIKINDNSNEYYYSCNGGVLEVKSNCVSILTEASEPISKIDKDRAEKSKKRAEERLRNQKEHTDHERARASLMRAINRIKLSEHK